MKIGAGRTVNTFEWPTGHEGGTTGDTSRPLGDGTFLL